MDGTEDLHFIEKRLVNTSISLDSKNFNNVAGIALTWAEHLYVKCSVNAAQQK